MAGEVLYVADGEGGLRVFDISRPGKLRQIAHRSEIEAHDVHLDGPTLFVAAGAAGLAAFDVRDPAAPRPLLAGFDLNGSDTATVDVRRLSVLFQYSRPNADDLEGPRSRPRPRRLAALGTMRRGIWLVDAAGDPIMDISHEGARWLSHEELLRVLGMPLLTLDGAAPSLVAGLTCVLATPPDAARAQEKPAGSDAPERTADERRAAAEDLFARLDKDRDLRLRGDELPAPSWLERFDRDGDDEITKKEMLTIVARGPGLDRLFVLRDPRARARNSLRQFDQDEDGFVGDGEYPGNDKVFKKADRNHDDRLDWKELVRLAEREIEDIRKRTKSPGRHDFLNLFDLDNDRRVSLNEYDGPARSFRKYDENGDGVVGYYEIYPNKRPRGAENARARPEDLNVIATLDANEDGRIGRDEWKGSQAAWKRLDRNGDGWITTADAR